MRTVDLILHGADRVLDAVALVERGQCSVLVLATTIEHNARTLRCIDAVLAAELGAFGLELYAAEGDVLAVGDVLDRLRAWRRRVALGTELPELAYEDLETEEVALAQ